ncbi:hypothetical protein LV84_02655 [Algoriphagus ratkowskyi]|uniref:Uncharacterized protein n=1 Tax=Algoriphagus ratkowskyi TaxID=57028 RepID=A0A2W7R8T6_9BACT|nr:hypothetical protein [Algoriphagus ratkowskyi]PZX55516.1 hypothetical protein LV84_02655 [Algoriphagus ratkowskyi]TXD79571.1 hypothetical protein ESW18_00085 [Algoriphagus ratkowskyi]
MDSVFVVFSGEHHLMEVSSRQLEGSLPVFRIEGVFSKELKCIEWIERNSVGKTASLLTYLEIPFDPIIGNIEKELQAFTVRLNNEFKILEVSLEENPIISYEKDYTYKVLKNGEILGSFWARDFIDACKVAYIRVKETLRKS